MKKVLPQFTNPQRRFKDEDQISKQIVQIGKAQRRYYIVQGVVIGLNHMFLVPKGADDIRIVYNGTSSGLNDVL